MIIETFEPGALKRVYQRLRDRGRLTPHGLMFLESWVSDDLTRCYQLMECDDPALLEQWVSVWEDLADFEIVPVIASDSSMWGAKSIIAIGRIPRIVSRLRGSTRARMASLSSRGSRSTPSSNAWVKPARMSGSAGAIRSAYRKLDR